MGLWTNHRLRQAGKYARASYRLQRHEAERREAVRHVALLWLRAQNRLALDAELRRLAPPRPDKEDR